MDYCGGNARKREIEEYIAAYKDINQHYLPIVHAEGAQPDYSLFSSHLHTLLATVKPPYFTHCIVTKLLAGPTRTDKSGVR